MKETLAPQEDPLEGEMAITPVFLPGKFQGQRSLTGYNPWGHKESDMTEVTELAYNIYIIMQLTKTCHSIFPFILT